MKIDLKELMHRAYVAGFTKSGEGYNAEYPFDYCQEQIERETWEDADTKISAILASVQVDTAPFTEPKP
jgi:hypothetical protein